MGAFKKIEREEMNKLQPECEATKEIDEKSRNAAWRQEPVSYTHLLDFLLRIPFQKTPTQEVKPYLLLPVKRNRIIDFLLIRSGLSLFNLCWL